MRLVWAAILLLYASVKVLQAGRLAQAIAAARRHERVQRQIAAERRLLSRLESALAASDSGWSRRL